MVDFRNKTVVDFYYQICLNVKPSALPAGGLVPFYSRTRLKDDSLLALMVIASCFLWFRPPEDGMISSS